MPHTTSRSRPFAPPLREDRLWAVLGAEWKQLGGSFRRHGFSFEWHELAPDREVDWGPTFHEDSVEICLNFAGRGHVAAGNQRLEL